MFRKNITAVTTFLLLAITMTFTFNENVSAKGISLKKQAITVNNTSNELLSTIDNYQQRYFTIIKRNDMLLSMEDDAKINKDRKELKKLYNEVKKQVKNKQYLKQYKKIEKRYAKCNEETMPGLNKFAEKNNKDVTALFNKVYKEVKSTIPAEDFQKLSLSEQNWEKEVENYKKVYDSKDFGSLGTVIYYDYQTDMKNFRTLLLMLYLKK